MGFQKPRGVQLRGGRRRSAQDDVGTTMALERIGIWAATQLHHPFFLHVTLYFEICIDLSIKLRRNKEQPTSETKSSNI